MQKLYCSIGEVAEMVGLEQHVLRFWETEFSDLKPEKNRSGNRAYRERDIDVVKKIQFLLYEEMFTIEGAKKKLKQLKRISLDEYKRSQILLLDAEFVKELQTILGMK